jgi:hypothetical protein
MLLSLVAFGPQPQVLNRSSDMLFQTALNRVVVGVRGYDVPHDRATTLQIRFFQPTLLAAQR